MKAFTLIVLAILLLVGTAAAGHRPVSCKGFMYWAILEPHGAGLQWRDVKSPIVTRYDPITPSVWNVTEAAERLLLLMHAKAQQMAGTSKVRVRNWDSVCWQFGDAEPRRHSWPVQP